VHRDDAPAVTTERPGRHYTNRPLSTVGGSRTTGLNHVVIASERRGWPRHCHASDEELFVILGGSGKLRVGDDEAAIRAGHVLSRPAGSGLAHSFRAGPDGLEYLAYGQRQPNDIAYYPDSGKVALWGVGVIGRIEPLDYWDGEDDPA
jgi:uncharacterized cupin superfamily protein